MILASRCNQNAIVALKIKTHQTSVKRFQKDDFRQDLHWNMALKWYTCICDWYITIKQTYYVFLSIHIVSQARLFQSIDVIFWHFHEDSRGWATAKCFIIRISPWWRPFMFPKVFSLNSGPGKNMLNNLNITKTDHWLAEGDPSLRLHGVGGHLGRHIGSWKMPIFVRDLLSRFCL